MAFFCCFSSTSSSSSSSSSSSFPRWFHQHSWGGRHDRQPCVDSTRNDDRMRRYPVLPFPLAASTPPPPSPPYTHSHTPGDPLKHGATHTATHPQPHRHRATHTATQAWSYTHSHTPSAAWAWSYTPRHTHREREREAGRRGRNGMRNGRGRYGAGALFE